MESPTPEQIKNARLLCGLTQTQAAQMIHVDMTTWQRYEYGNRKIPPASWELFLIKTGQIALQIQPLAVS